MATAFLSAVFSIMVLKTLLVADNILERHGRGGILRRLSQCWRYIPESSELSTTSNAVAQGGHASRFRCESAMGSASRAMNFSELPLPEEFAPRSYNCSSLLYDLLDIASRGFHEISRSESEPKVALSCWYLATIDSVACRASTVVNTKDETHTQRKIKGD